MKNHGDGSDIVRSCTASEWRSWGLIQVTDRTAHPCPKGTYQGMEESQHMGQKPWILAPALQLNVCYVTANT